MATIVLVVLSLLTCSASWCGESGSVTIAAERDGETLLLPVNDVAQAMGWEVKVVSAGKLLAFCRDDICIPIQLETVKQRMLPGGLYVDARALSRPLGLMVVEEGGAVSIRKAAANVNDDVSGIPAYNAAWGPNRGFRKGQTVPDIPLFDLQGKEVRFSKFLGKQYIIYVWASW